MIRQSTVGLVLAIVTACSAQQSPVKRDQQPSDSRGSLKLSLTIRADRQAYRMNEAVHLEVQLTNTGSSTLYLYDDVCWNPGNFLTMHVFTVDGKEVSGKSDYLRDCLPPPPRRNDISRFFRLEPETFYGVTENFTVRELVPAPGEYEVVVYYEAALSANWIAKYGADKLADLRIWTRDQPLLRSNHLRVSIRP